MAIFKIVFQFNKNVLFMASTNISLGIKRLPYSRMMKSEMADYVEKTISIVQDHDLESTLIDPVFSLLKKKEPEVKLLRLSYGIDTQRLKANKLKAELMLQISAFKLKVKLLNRSNLELDLHVVQNAINSHLKYLNKCKNDKELNQKVAGFLDLNNNDLTLMTAIEEYNLTSGVDAIAAAHLTVNDAWETRVELLSKRPNISTKSIVKGMWATINDLFKGIETAHLLSTLAEGEEAGLQKDFVPLIDELNQLSEMYYRSISIRDANNKRKAELEKERNPMSARMYAMSEIEEYGDEDPYLYDDDDEEIESDYDESDIDFQDEDAEMG